MTRYPNPPLPNGKDPDSPLDVPDDELPPRDADLDRSVPEENKDD